MPSLLIKIKKALWYKTATTTFRNAPDVSTDCLFDLRVSDNELSVWYLHDDKSNLERLLTALAATRDSPSNIDYLIFDYSVPATFNIEIKKSEGETPDTEANGLWHYDLRRLSARQLAEFVVEIHHSGLPGRLQEKHVKNLIIQGVEQSRLNLRKIKPNLVRVLSLGQRRASPISRMKRFFQRLW